MTDRKWVEWAAIDDDAWHERIGREFGLDARPKEMMPWKSHCPSEVVASVGRFQEA